MPLKETGFSLNSIHPQVGVVGVYGVKGPHKRWVSSAAASLTSTVVGPIRDKM